MKFNKKFASNFVENLTGNIIELHGADMVLYCIPERATIRHVALTDYASVISCSLTN